MGVHLDPVAKGLVLAGVLLIVAGIAWQLGWLQALRLGRLPGDLVIERENARFYFPLATSILLSVVLSVLMWLWKR